MHKVVAVMHEVAEQFKDCEQQERKDDQSELLCIIRGEHSTGHLHGHRRCLPVLRSVKVLLQGDPGAECRHSDARKEKVTGVSEVDSICW